MTTTIVLNSRWALADGRVFSVIQKKPGGLLDLKQEGRAYFMNITQKDLRAMMTPVAGLGVSPFAEVQA